jgi:hypothetical protein
MNTKIVNSEDPKEHWNDIKKVDGMIVMDLGCGWLFQPHESTPEYFINRGAKLVVGIDAAGGEIQQLTEKYPDHIFICKDISTKNDLCELFDEYMPDVVKMDIEGYESLIDEMDASHFISIQELAIEYHNPICKEILDRKLPEFGFTITNVNQFGWFCTDTNIMGIIHAIRL